MGTSAGIHVQFVCMRPSHHRHRTRPLSVCEHKGCAAYCPAGDVDGHDWLAVSTDLARLAGLGYVQEGPGELDERQGREAADHLALSR